MLTEEESKQVGDAIQRAQFLDQMNAKKEVEMPQLIDWNEIDTTRAMQRTSECEKFLSEIEDVEMQQKMISSLQSQLDILKRFGNAILYHDFAPLSFGFAAGGLIGGLIFHGNHDGGGNGGAPTFSVCLTPHTGWSLHT